MLPSVLQGAVVSSIVVHISVELIKLRTEAKADESHKRF